MLTFHATGDWAKEQLRVRQAPSTRRVVAEVEALIEEAWQAARQPGVHLFDGAMCRLESWHAGAEGLELVLSETSYKPFLGTNLHHPEVADRFGVSVLANPVGVSPALETIDGWLMMGRRNGSVAYYPHKVHPFAGALEPRDAMDLFGAVRRELAEELGFTAADVGEIRCTGIAEDRSIRQPELIFRVQTTRTRAEVEATLDRTEHQGSWAVEASRESIEVVLGDVGGMTPVAVAALLLWGRARFGEEWFRGHSEFSL